MRLLLDTHTFLWFLLGYKWLTVAINIKPGTYSERIGTSKHIHFVTNGSGTVRIGG